MNADFSLNVRAPEASVAAAVTVGVCETQPVTAEGLKVLLSRCGDMDFLRWVPSLQAGLEMVRTLRPSVVLADKGLGLQAMLQWIVDLRSLSVPTAIAVWGIAVTEPEVLRLVRAGAKGIIRKSAPPETLLECLRSVASGATWMEESIFRGPQPSLPWVSCELTPREQQVLQLVQQGLRNGDIGRELGIRAGTVKIHLRHIFEKTGVRGRYGLVMSGLRDKNLVGMPQA